MMATYGSIARMRIAWYRLVKPEEPVQFHWMLRYTAYDLVKFTPYPVYPPSSIQRRFTSIYFVRASQEWNLKEWTH